MSVLARGVNWRRPREPLLAIRLGLMASKSQVTAFADIGRRKPTDRYQPEAVTVLWVRFCGYAEERKLCSAVAATGKCTTRHCGWSIYLRNLGLKLVSHGDFPERAFGTMRVVR